VNRVTRLLGDVIPGLNSSKNIVLTDICRYPQAENQPHILALSVFSDTQIQRLKPKELKFSQRLKIMYFSICLNKK